VGVETLIKGKAVCTGINGTVGEFDFFKIPLLLQGGDSVVNPGTPGERRRGGQEDSPRTTTSDFLSGRFENLSPP
jgi:hypothetical protein